MVKRGRAASDTSSEAGLQNNLRAVRTRLNLSQSALAQAAGVTRQTIGGIEASLYAPSAVVALKLARALGCRVEELFWVEDEAASILPVRLAQGSEDRLSREEPPLDKPASQTYNQIPNVRVLLGQVDGEWVAHPLSGEAAWRSEMVPADGILEDENGYEGEYAGVAFDEKVRGNTPPSGKHTARRTYARTLDTSEALSRTALIAGCAPALSLWTRSAERWHPGLRAAWLHANSTQALSALARGEVHIAGLHMCGTEGEDNVPLVRRVFGESPTSASPLLLLNFGIWEEGLMVAHGNPLKVRGVADLERPDVTLINREVGSGARALLDMLLSKAGLAGAPVRGYQTCASSHQAVARAVQQGQADAGVGAQAVAEAFGLDFVPLRRVRYDLALRAASLEFEPVRDVLDALEHRRVRAQLRLLGGYDTALTGEIVARLDLARQSPAERMGSAAIATDRRL